MSRRASASCCAPTIRCAGRASPPCWRPPATLGHRHARRDAVRPGARRRTAGRGRGAGGRADRPGNATANRPPACCLARSPQRNSIPHCARSPPGCWCVYRAAIRRDGFGAAGGRRIAAADAARGGDPDPRRSGHEQQGGGTRTRHLGAHGEVPSRGAVRQAGCNQPRRGGGQGPARRGDRAVISGV